MNRLSSIILIFVFLFVSTVHIENLSKHYLLKKPDLQGPYPAVILVSGCSGFGVKFRKKTYDEAQNKLV